MADLHSQSPEQEIVITRVFDAPRDLVWRAWSDRDALAQWWGPQGFLMDVTRFEFVPGGIFLYSMSPGAGDPIWGKFTYGVISAPGQLEYISAFSDKDGGVTRNPWMATWPLEVMNTLTLEEMDGQTMVTVRSAPLNASEEERKTFDAARESIQQGFLGTWEKLEEYLEKMQ